MIICYNKTSIRCSMTITDKIYIQPFSQTTSTIVKVKVKDSKITIKIKQSPAVWKKVKPVSYLFNTPIFKHSFTNIHSLINIQTQFHIYSTHEYSNTSL